MGQPVVHFEIGCRDQKKTADFFSRLFDWKTENVGPAAMIQTGGAGGAFTGTIGKGAGGFGTVASATNTKVIPLVCK